jgi:hypothetical protein
MALVDAPDRHPFWDPWLALMVLIVAVFLIVRGVARMLRP